MMHAGQVQSIATTHSFVLVKQETSRSLWCICQKCKACQKVDADTIHQSLDQAARFNGFRPSRCHVELIGLCSTCSSRGQGLTM